MPIPVRLLVLPMVVMLAAAWTEPSRVSGLRLVAADDQGATLRIDVPEHSLAPAAQADRWTIEAPGLEILSLPGRPRLPFSAALIALPPGARPRIRVVESSSEVASEGVRLAIAPRAALREDEGALGIVSALEDTTPIRDGAWPREAAEIDPPFTVRHQSVAVVRLLPFRYDEATATLWARRSLTVRIEFGAPATRTAAAAEPDPGWEPVLAGAVLNYEQGRSFRLRREGAPASLPRLPPPGSPEARSRSGIAGVDGFDESEPEVRVTLDTTGVYALEFQTLRQQGYPTGVPLAEVSVHRHEYVEDADPPYRTVELPIEVVDADGDGGFGEGDRILVFVQSWAERSRASGSQRAWGDGEVVFVTRLSGRSGRRMGTRAGWLDLSLAPLPSYPHSQRWEESTAYLPVFQPGWSDTNTDAFLWSRTGTLVQLHAVPDSFRFATHDLDTARAIRFGVTWQGTRANNHFSWAAIRNGGGRVSSIVDSANWLGRGAFARSVTLPGSALSEGATNVLLAWGRNRDCQDPADVECLRVNAVVDFFEATYWRRFRALGGRLACGSGGASGAIEIHATGFESSDVRVYDVSDSLDPVRLEGARIARSGAAHEARFQDTVPPGETRAYVVFDRARVVPADRYAAVTRHRLTARTSGDYLVIAPESFLGAVGPLAALRESQGMTVVTAPLEAINDEFNGGRRSPYALKRFIRHAYRHWNASAVILVGDGSEDPQNLLGGAGKDWIPAPRVSGAVGIYDGASYIYEAIVGDPWYVWCVDCADPAAQPKIHDLFLGRLPANSIQQAAAMVSKIVAYENLAADQAWRSDLLLAADDAYSTLSFFGGGAPGDNQYCERTSEDVFLKISRRLQSVVTEEAGLVLSNPEVFDLDELLAGEPVVPGDPPCRVSWSDTRQHTRLDVTRQLIEKLNRGRLWWNFQGHANPSVLTHEDLYVNRPSEDDALRLMNDGAPFLFSAFSCHTNAFGRVNEATSSVGFSLGEDLMLLPNRGAIGAWASTGFEALPLNEVTHLNVHFARALFAPPPSMLGPSAFDGRVVLGAAIARALLDNLRTTRLPTEREVGISYALLGDPATRISIGAVQITVTANGVRVENGKPVRLDAVAGDSLLIEAELASNTGITGIVLERTDGLGTHVIPPDEYRLTPAFPDTGGTAGRRYRLSHGTTLGVGALSYALSATDRNGLTGRFQIPFRFVTVLRADGVPVEPGDPVSPSAHLSLVVVSPGRVEDPGIDFVLTLNGAAVPFVASPHGEASTDWELSWKHAPYPAGEYRLVLAVAGEVSVEHAFRVDSATRFENVVAFPNPMDDRGTHFSFTLASGDAASVQIRVYTVSGRLVYERTRHDLPPGYHQLAWDGRDAERDELANGVYVYRLLARGSDGSAVHEGRLVKLRTPHGARAAR